MRSTHRRKPLARRTPIARKAVRRGKPKRPSCDVRGCKARLWVLGLCRKHAVREADQLFSIAIRRRDGRCVGPGPHAGRLECSHHITRNKYHVRFDPDNAVTHCSACHKTFTENWGLHMEWILGYLGYEGWDELMDKAYGPKDPETGRRASRGPWTAADHEAVLVRLRYGMEEAA